MAVVAYPDVSAVDEFFESNDRFIRDTVLPNIDKYRKSNATIVVLDEEGMPAAGWNISVAQFEQRFLWGCVPSIEDPKWATPEVFKLWRSVFNFAIPENALKWRSIEQKRGVRDFSRADWLVNTINDSGGQVELHFLTGYLPKWISKVPEKERPELQRQHALETLEHFRGRVRLFQVYNEVLLENRDDHARVYFPLRTFFEELARRNPGVRFGISECWSWRAPPGERQQIDVHRLRSTFPGISFIAAHGHSPPGYYATPEEVYRSFEGTVGSGIKAQLTEFGVVDGIVSGTMQGRWTEQLRLRYLVSVYATIFSHPSFEAFHQWGMGPRVNRWTANTLIDKDGKPLPAYYTIKELIKERFTTRVRGITDASGGFSFRGFHGRYLVTLINNGRTAVAELVMDDKEKSYVLRLQRSLEGLRLEGGEDVVHLAMRDCGESSGHLMIRHGHRVVFDQLEDARRLEIFDGQKRQVREWKLIGDRIEWDGTDERGEPVPPGTYLIRKTTMEGWELERTLVAH